MSTGTKDRCSLEKRNGLRWQGGRGPSQEAKGPSKLCSSLNRGPKYKAPASHVQGSGSCMKLLGFVTSEATLQRGGVLFLHAEAWT